MTQTLKNFHAILNSMDGNDIGICFVVIGKAFQYSAGYGEEAGGSRRIEGVVIFRDILIDGRCI